MKKILLAILTFFISFSVNASSKAVDTKYEIEDIIVSFNEKIGYDEKLEITYSINPRDAYNTKLLWSVSGLKDGVTVLFDNNETSNTDGKITLTINNSTDEDVTISLIAKQNGKVLLTKELSIESKNTTNERVKEEVVRLIKSLDEKINSDNYDSIKESLDSIESLLTDEIKKLIDSDLISKYEEVKGNMTVYEDTQGKTFTIIVSIVLVILFVIGMFLVFKKEED